MKNTFLKTARKTFILFTLGTNFTVGIANANPTNPVLANRQPTVETISRQSLGDPQKMYLSVPKINSKGRLTISQANRNSFEMGQRLTFAIFDAKGLDDDGKSYQFLIVDLVELIDKFEGQPEAVELQKVLTSVVRKTAGSAVVQAEIETFSRKYLAQLANEQQWYFNSAANLIKVIVFSYLGGEAELKNSLSEMQALITIAPKESPVEMLEPMRELVKYLAQTTVTGDDFFAIFEKAQGITETVMS